MHIAVSDLEPTAAYHLLTGLVIPRPIAWVSSLDTDGRRNLAPFSFFQGVSSDPVSVIVSIGRHAEGGAKDSRANVLASRELVVNIVSEDLAEAMNVTASDVLPEVDEFELAGVTALPSVHVAPPRVAESPAALECRVTDTVTIGRAPSDYLLFVCEVLAYHVRDDVMVDGRVDPTLLRPLLRLGGSGYARMGDVFQMPRPRADRTRPG